MRASKVTTTSTSERTRIAVIDDDIFIREAWGLLCQEFDAVTFQSPEEFLEFLARIPEFAETLDVIITDYNFGNFSQMSGADFAEQLRPLTKIPIILSTDMSQSDIRGRDLFDLFLDKNIINWRALGELIPILRQS